MPSHPQSVTDLIRRMPAGPARAAAERGYRMVLDLQGQGIVSPHFETALQQVAAAKPTADRMYVEQQALQERQSAAEREVAAYRTQLGPDHLAGAEHIYAQGGWPALREALAPDLSPDALAVLDATHDQLGFQGLAQAVTARAQEYVQEQTAAQVEAQTLEKWNPAKAADPTTQRILEGSPLAASIRDPNFRASAKAWWKEHGPQMEAVGLGLKAHEDPAEALLSLAFKMGRDGTKPSEQSRPAFGEHWDADKATAALAKLVGEKDVKAIRKFLESADDASTSHGIQVRLAQYDAKRHAQRTASARQETGASRSSREASPAVRKTEPAGRLRADVERAVRQERPQGRAKPEPYAAGNHLQATIARAAGMEVVPLHGSSHAEKAVAEVNAQMDANEAESTNGDGANE